MAFAKVRAFQLTVKTVNAFVFFNFLSGPLSLLYMQVPSSKHIERTLLVGC